jgi:osmoprotectant transport system permease protein
MVWLWENRDLVLGLTLVHARLSIIPIVVAFTASVPLGWVANRHPVLRFIILFVAGVLFTVPSIALFIVLPPILGTRILDEANIVVALSIYGVALMARGGADAFASVPRDVTYSSTAIGFSGANRFFAVELPLAGPVLLANLRVVAVSTVSLVSVGSLIGVDSLGTLFLNGYQRTFPTEIVIGIVFVVLLAVAFDRALVAIGRLLMPWTKIRAINQRGLRLPLATGVPSEPVR